MQALAIFLDGCLNDGATGADRKTGFILLVFPFGGGDGRCNYISNGADRGEVERLLREQADRFAASAGDPKAGV